MIVDVEKCVGCPICMEDCPLDAITLIEKKAVIFASLCVNSLRLGAFVASRTSSRLRFKKMEQKHPSMTNGIVFALSLSKSCRSL